MTRRLASARDLRCSSRCRRSRSRPTSRAATRRSSTPRREWTLHEWVPIHLGPIDMSINKAVAYLILGAVLSCVIGIVFMRVKVGTEPTERRRSAR